MGTFDERGWAPVHRAAHDGDAAALETLLAPPGAAERLELETRDGLRSTPLLVAATGGRRRCLELLAARGARLDATDMRNRGLAELCALHGGAAALEHMLEMPAGTRPFHPHRLLVRGVGSDNGDVAEAVSCALAELLARRDFADRHLEALAREGLAPVLLRVLGTFGGAAACVGGLRVLAAVARHPPGRGLVVATGGFVQLLVGVAGGAGPDPALRGAVEVLREVAGLREHRAALVAAGAVPALAKAVQVAAALNNDDKDDGFHVGLQCAAMAVETLGLIAEGDAGLQHAVGKQKGFLPTLCVLLARVPSEAPAAPGLCRAAEAIAAGRAHNQDALVAGGGAAALVRLARAPARELQLCAIEALRGLVEGNEGARRAALELGAAGPMLQMLRRSRVERVLEAAGTALWALAGGDIDRETALATMMGAETLVEFAHSAAERLQLLGAWGVSALARGGGGVARRPPGVTEPPGPSPLVQALLRLLQTRSRPVLLAALPALRALCLGVGYVPCPAHQLQVLNSPCVDLLLELAGPATSPAPPGPPKTPEVQVEAIWTLASVWLGNPARPAASARAAQLAERLLRLLRSAPADEALRVGAGAALAALAFHGPGTLRQIQRAGGLRSRHLLPALDSSRDRHRVGAAFQVVVLARAVVDGKAAALRARGMGALVDSLCRSRHKETLELAADCIARLARMREGVPEALVAVDVVQLLWPLLDGQSERTRRAAALALGHLSFTHPAVRLILRRCRESPRLAGVLLHHTQQQQHALCPALLQAWTHYCALALPGLRDTADPAPPSDPSADVFTQATAQLLSGSLAAPPGQPSDGTPRSVSQLTLGSLALSPGR